MSPCKLKSVCLHGNNVHKCLIKFQFEGLKQYCNERDETVSVIVIIILVFVQTTLQFFWLNLHLFLDWLDRASIKI